VSAEGRSGTVRVCVVGAGRAGTVHARNVRWHVPHAELVALADSDRALAARLAVELDLPGGDHDSLEQALERVEFEAVVITTPTFTHGSLAVLAAASGRHVLCEKPMALTLEECDRMIAAAQSAGVVLQIGFMRRFDPPFAEARRQIDEGLIGRPLIVRSLTRGPGLPPAWAHDLRQSNGMLAEVNSHDFDTVRWLSGAEIRRVFALAGAMKAPEVRRRFPDFYDTAVVALELDNQAFGVIDGVCPADYGYDARAEVVGTEGTIVIGGLRSEATVRVTRPEGAVGPRFTSWQERFARAYQAEATHFVECILTGRPPSVGGHDGRQALAGVLAANRSIATGQPVTLPLAGEGEAWV
jgi:myo-inositol 2-dehydrogenase/D-chiro-inositol 1-dehydrogenase/scyllo-inositol 2-dehydrogenase (NAD+)